MAEQGYRSNEAGLADDESLTKPEAFGTTPVGKFSTTRTAGFRGGTRTAEGNLSFEGGRALRGIRSQRRTDSATAEAQARHDALVRSDAEQKRRDAIEDAKPTRTEEFLVNTGGVVEDLGHNIEDTIIKPITVINEGLGEVKSGADSIGSAVEKNVTQPVKSVGRAIAKPFGTVICTQLMTQGLLSTRLWRDSAIHSRGISSCAMRGYHAWAIPYVRLMRKYPLATFLVKDIFRWRSEEVSYQIGCRAKGNIKGKVVCAILTVICTAIGYLCSEKDFNSLYEPKRG